ncbi:MAG TPA: PAS domain S-box protein [Candidatus Angelobacter sp.]|nr:PAS domain S-box protein [Candidatus Angelobacter sp.]
MEKQLLYERTIARLAVMALNSDMFEATLQGLCSDIAQTLKFNALQVIELDWSRHASHTLAQTGESLTADFGCGLAGFASTLVGQPVFSDLLTEGRFQVEPELRAAGLSAALALCSAEASSMCFTVVCGYWDRDTAINEQDEQFFTRAADLVAKAVRQERDKKQLLDQAARYSALFESAADAILCISLDGRMLDVNPNAVLMLGYSRDELMAMTLFDLLAPESYTMTRKMMDEKIAGRRRTIYESTFVGKGGMLIPAEVNSAPVRDSKGEIVGLQGIVRDLRSRKLAEKALLASEGRFRSVVESEMIGIVFWNGKGLITDANKAFLSMLGYSHEEVLAGALHWDAITDSGGPETVFAARLRGQQQVVPFEMECLQKNGSRVPVLIGGATLEGTDNSGVGFVLDITERKQLQRQFQHAQKMEAVGQLAAGIAHDFNNILMGISSFAELLHVMSADDPKKQAYTQQILAASARAAELVEQLLVFSAKRSVKAEPVNLIRTLQECRNLLKQILGPKCELQMDLPHGLCNVIADPVQLEQVILNLASNARDAMPKGGIFRVNLAQLKLSKPETTQNVSVPAGSYALLTFSDTGAGIKPELVNRIFEPFFTTKATGEGTGLGLAMVYAVVKQCGGYIFVESVQGAGTVFRLFLPLTARQTATTAKAALVARSPVPGTGILLVDDELQIRFSCAEYLRDLGYDVFEAADAKIALDLFSANPDRIRMLITDVVMPGMDGKDLALELKRRKPDLVVLFMSGYTGNSAAGLEEISSVRMLMKPMALSTLADAVSKALHSQLSEEVSRG